MLPRMSVIYSIGNWAWMFPDEPDFVGSPSLHVQDEEEEEEDKKIQRLIDFLREKSQIMRYKLG